MNSPFREYRNFTDFASGYTCLRSFSVAPRSILDTKATVPSDTLSYDTVNFDPLMYSGLIGQAARTAGDGKITRKRLQTK